MSGDDRPARHLRIVRAATDTVASRLPAPIEGFVQRLGELAASHRVQAGSFPRASAEAERWLDAGTRADDLAGDIRRRFDSIAQWRAANWPSDQEGRAR